MRPGAHIIQTTCWLTCSSAGSSAHLREASAVGRASSLDFPHQVVEIEFTLTECDIRTLQEPKHLEDLTGLTAMHAAAEALEDFAFDESDDGSTAGHSDTWTAL